VELPKDVKLTTKEKLPPFDMGIKDFKRLVRQNPLLTKGQKSEAIRMYKERVYERVDDIKKKMKEANGREDKSSSDKEQASNLPMGGKQGLLRQPPKQVKAA
jgi:hypothetical protein